MIEEFKRLVKKYGVEDEVDLQATFCVGNCMNGVSVISDGVLVHNANKDNAEELFLTEVVSGRRLFPARCLSGCQETALPFSDIG